MTNDPSSHEPHESFKDKFKASLNDIHSNEKFGTLVNYATANTRDTISYIALIIGIVLLFFNLFYGSALVGFIGGLYFSAELIAFVKNFSALVDDQGIVRSLIAGGVILTLFICAPGLYIGVALAVATRQVLFPTNL